MANSKLLCVIIISLAFLCLGWREHNDPASGVVVFRMKTWDAKLKKYVAPKNSDGMKIWYRDSLLIYHSRAKIAEATGNSPFRNDVGKTLDIYHFRNGRFSEWQYVDFAATAPVKEATLMNDSTGWSLKQLASFPYGDDLFGFPMESLPDTVIDGVHYRRLKNEHIRFDNDPGADEYSFVGYLRCDKKNLPFALSKKFDERWGCMLTRIEYQVRGVSPWFLVEIEFQQNELSASEQAIFDTWEKNAKNDPVFYSPETKDYITPAGPIPVRDSFLFCGVRYKIPRDCKGKSQANCCSANTSPDQLACYNGTSLFWHYMQDEKTAQLNFESFSDQWKKQMKSFQKKPVKCFLAGRPVEAYRISYTTRTGHKFHCILTYGTVNGQSVVAELSSSKRLKSNKDIQGIFRQIIQLEE